MFTKLNGGGSKNTARILFAVFVVANVVTGVTIAASGIYETTGFEDGSTGDWVIGNDKGTSGSFQTLVDNSRSYDGEYAFRIHDSGDSNSIKSEIYTPDAYDTFNTTYRAYDDSGSTATHGSRFVFGAATQTTGDGYKIRWNSRDGMQLLDGSNNVIKSKSPGDPPQGEWYKIHAQMNDSGGLTVTYLNDSTGAEMAELTYQFDSIPEGYLGFGGQYGNQQTGDYYIDIIRLELEDTDGDGVADKNDAYPNDAPVTHTLTPDENETVESAYIEASNGSFEASVYGVNSTSGEVTLLTTGSKTVDSTMLVEFDVTHGYDDYRIKYHGNATLHSHGLLYAPNSGGGGVSQDSFDSAISLIVGNQGALQTQNIMLGGLIVVVGVTLFLRGD